MTDDFLCDFWWFCWLGLGNPCHIATKTHMEKLNQNLGLADPPRQLGQMTKFFDRFNLRAPLIQHKQLKQKNKRGSSDSIAWFDFFLFLSPVLFAFVLFFPCPLFLPPVYIVDHTWSCQGLERMIGQSPYTKGEMGGKKKYRQTKNQIKIKIQSQWEKKCSNSLMSRLLWE